ncbi:transglutaminase-like putative cysteine protease [Anaerosolibacter carboniphilus]|uniref:Transglutaminase-like putative cysteine protease n=1 Tax=Anaerosolibacter carboniphilus TaxID=1417629 RepID=A0A841KQF9_9FIRM|nr:transglutaminase-like domain-containing protein [Anaerosolibacter carboniphilus]MBB6214348.1 transglutaminase-like putative cysteine protease [Anaerosolibacter carboniphilus]
MKSKLFFNVLLLWTTFTFIMMMGQAVYAEETNYITKNGVSVVKLDSRQVEGSVSLEGKTQKEKIKLLVKKDSTSTWLDVNVKNGKFQENIWLTQGTGDYSISIMIHEEDRKYSYGPTLNIENKTAINKYLSPTKHVESDDEEIIKLAKEITNVNDTELDKAKAIYRWVVENITYDYEKYNKHQNNDYDNNYGAVYTYTTKKGVCYDYATLTAALSRAVGIQTKVVKGEGKLGSFKGLHAWNEIFIPEKGQWIPVDTTFGNTTGKDFFDNVDFYTSHTKTEEY